MVREAVIWLYLTLFRLLFDIVKLLFPVRQKVTFVNSFGWNSFFIHEEMKKRNLPHEVVFLCKSGCRTPVDGSGGVTVLRFESTNLVHQILSIYHLATSKVIFIDNYFGFLSKVEFKEGVQCIQLWHAAGAVKLFGLEDKAVPDRSERAKKRFSEVYEKFDKVVVGSDRMADIFSEAFNLSHEKIWRTGIPRTDLFFDGHLQGKVKRKLIEANPILSQKKVILYAPTFRDHELKHFDFRLDLELLEKELGDEYVLLIRLHPAIKKKVDLEQEYPGFVYDYSAYPDVNELLLVTDMLITDYSSIPVEFSLLERPMLFFAYDVEEYEKERGFWGEYEKVVPGPVVNRTEDVVSFVKEGKFDFTRIKAFKNEWNKYSRGNASEQIVDRLIGDEGEVKISIGS